MTGIDAMQLLREKVNELGQSETARQLNVSSSAICQLISGKYKASPDCILQKVVEMFGGLAVMCPVMGKVPLSQCAEEQRRPFAPTNHLRVRLYQACKSCKEKPV